MAPSAKLNPFERAISQVTQVETKSFVIPTFLGSTRTEGHRTANTESIDSRYEEEEEEEEKEEEAGGGSSEEEDDRESDEEKAGGWWPSGASHPSIDDILSDENFAIMTRQARQAHGETKKREPRQESHEELLDPADLNGESSSMKAVWSLPILDACEADPGIEAFRFSLSESGGH